MILKQKMNFTLSEEQVLLSEESNQNLKYFKINVS